MKTNVWMLWGLLLAVVIFLTNVLYRLDRPLMWNDEAETAVFGERILRYGYPKANDGHNYINLLEVREPFRGVDSVTGAYLVSGWVQYYVAALGVFLSNYVSDLYTKTFWVRLPFSIIGLVGVFLAVMIGSLAIRKKDRLMFLYGYVGLQIGATSLVLHLREARYYSVSLFWVSFVVSLWFLYKFLKRINYRWYLVLTTIALVGMFNTYYLGFFGLIVGLVGWEMVEIVAEFRKVTYRRKEIIITHLKGCMPIFVSITLILPLIRYFQIIEISKSSFEIFPSTLGDYMFNIIASLRILIKHAFLYPIIFLSIYCVLVWKELRIAVKAKYNGIKDYLVTGAFYLVVSMGYVLVIARVPRILLFERYLISIQPLLIIAELIIFIGLVTNLTKWKSKFIGVFSMGLLFNYWLLWPTITGRINEVINGYIGPIDEVITYLDERYSGSKHLVIATNYEEAAYMYYLGAKVLFGYFGKTADQDRKITPDVVVPRIYNRSRTYPEAMNDLETVLAAGDYSLIRLPVKDFPVNNLPELEWVIKHQFYTLATNNEKQMMPIFIRNQLISRPPSTN